MRILIVINDPPYGTEKAYNALRLAMTLQKEQAEVQLRVFLMADAVGCGRTGQATPQGYYNLERMLRSVVSRGGEVGLCGSCMDARGLKEANWVEGAVRSSMSQLAEWTVQADNVLVF